MEFFSGGSLVTDRASKRTIMVSSPTWIFETDCGCISQSTSLKILNWWCPQRLTWDLLCLFSSPIPPMEINMVEVYAIHCAIALTINCSRLNCQELIIESDSSNAVKWCTTDTGGPCNVQFIVNYIRNAAKHELAISITHKGRSSDVVADGLARQGLRRLDGFVVLL